MIIIPKGKVVITGLNSYYIDIEKLCDYYHEVVGTCAIYLKSGSASGIVFYDNSDYLGGGLQNNNDLDTVDVAEKLVESTSSDNFNITVLAIDPNDIYYWSSLLHVKSIYSGLKSDFTDITALIKQLQREKLTGYIEVLLNDVQAGGLFFRNGKIVHSVLNTAEKSPGDLSGANEDLRALLSFAKSSSGVFNVKEILAQKPLVEKNGPKNVPATSSDSQMLPLMESLLAALNKILSPKHSRGFDFDLVLKKKFVEKADQYDFLDPFAAEFEYADSKVAYRGAAELKLVAKAVFESTQELAHENGLSGQFESEIDTLKTQYANEFREIENAA